MSIELGTVQTGNGKVDPARKFKCILATASYSSHTGLNDIVASQVLIIRISSFPIRAVIIRL